MKWRFPVLGTVGCFNLLQACTRNLVTRQTRCIRGSTTFDLVARFSVYILTKMLATWNVRLRGFFLKRHRSVIQRNERGISKNFLTHDGRRWLSYAKTYLE